MEERERKREKGEGEKKIKMENENEKRGCFNDKFQRIFLQRAGGKRGRFSVN